MSARKAVSARKNRAHAAKATATAASDHVPTFRARLELPLLLPLLVALFAATAPVIPGQFLHWDDRTTIAKNPWLRPGSPEPFTHFWRHPHMALYVPVTYDVWAALTQIAATQPSPADPLGLDPRPFHLANVIVHAIAALLVYAILRRIAGVPAALVGAIVFALHPVQAEPVAWISGTKDLLCGALCLAALWIDPLPAPDQPSNRRDGSWRRYAIATLLFIAAVLAKPTAMILPGLVLVLGWGRGRPIRPMFVRIAPWFVISLACAAWTKAVQPVAQLAHAPLRMRPIVAGHAIGTDVWHLLLPLRLCVDYGYSPRWLQTHRAAWLVALVPVALAAVLVVFRRRARWLIVAGAIFVIGLLPVLGLVAFDFQFYSTVADHYLYLPMFGVALAVAWAVARLPFRAQVISGAVLLALLGPLIWMQVRPWRSDRDLFNHTLSINPRSLAALSTLASLELDEGHAREAEDYARRALAVHDDFPTAWVSLAAARSMQGKTDEALAAYRSALDLSPNDPRILLNYGIALAQSGRLEQARATLENAVQLAPDDARAHMNLGTVYVNLNRPDLARREYEQAIALDDSDPQAHANLGFVLAGLHDLSRARDEFNAALRLSPGYPPAVEGLRELQGQ